MKQLIFTIFLLFSITTSGNAQKWKMGLEAGMQFQHLKGEEIILNQNRIYPYFVDDERTLIGIYFEYQLLKPVSLQLSTRHYFISYRINHELFNDDFPVTYNSPADAYAGAIDISLLAKFNLLDVVTINAGGGYYFYNNKSEISSSTDQDLYPEFYKLNHLIENNFKELNGFIMWGPSAKFGRLSVNLLMQIGLSNAIKNMNWNNEMINLGFKSRRVFFHLGYDVFRFGQKGNR